MRARPTSQPNNQYVFREQRRADRPWLAAVRAQEWAQARGPATRRRMRVEPGERRTEGQAMARAARTTATP
ncbi:MAG TPA: hypothetical protein VE549_16020 [Myxococcaceae bacterium]|nr:hypothetical protein [Myxococcaceae bacterium]